MNTWGHEPGEAAPTGLARRPRRLPEHETEQRMLGAAMATVDRAGLTVSLDHISFEDIIRDADVSRSAVYRRWPHKDLFFSDLVKHLARNATPAIARDEVAMLIQVATEHQDWLETPELRHSLVVELFRRLALYDFDTINASSRRPAIASLMISSAAPEPYISAVSRCVMPLSSPARSAATTALRLALSMFQVPCPIIGTLVFR